MQQGKTVTIYKVLSNGKSQKGCIIHCDNLENENLTVDLI